MSQEAFSFGQIRMSVTFHITHEHLGEKSGLTRPRSGEQQVMAAEQLTQTGPWERPRRRPAGWSEVGDGVTEPPQGGGGGQNRFSLN